MHMPKLHIIEFSGLSSVAGGAKAAGEIIGHGGRVLGRWEFTPRAAR
jgi:hypothetical protein